MRESTEPYCFIMLAPRVRRGGTMRPENSSKLWLNTFCEWSRASTLLSSVTPERPAWIADCAMPLEAASFLKSSSQASNVPLPQGAATDGAADVRSSAPSAKFRKEKREVMKSCTPKSTAPSSTDHTECSRQPRPKQGYLFAHGRGKCVTMCRRPHARPPVDRPAVWSRCSSALTKSLCAVPAPPRKQVRGEIGGGLAFAPTRRDWVCIRVPDNYLAVEMPGGVAEQRNDDREANEEWQRSQNQQPRHDQSP